MTILRSILFTSLVLGFTWACGSSSNEASDDTGITWETVDDADTTQAEPEPEIVQEVEADYKPAGQGVLSFVETFGDDAKTCVQTDLCTFNVSFNGDRSLGVIYLEDGAPVANVPLQFTIIEDPGQVGKMVVATVYTDQAGAASGTVKAMKAVSASFKVKVTVAGAPDIAPIYFGINVQPKVQAYLTVSFIYGGQRTFDGVRVYLIKNTATNVADVFCGDIDPLDLPTADLIQGPVQLSQTVKFQTLPGLEDEGEQRYTVIARGETGDGQAMTFGCDEDEGIVRLTSTTHVTIDLIDIAPRIVGEYDITTELDLLSPLPDDVEDTVNTILDFFDKPSASLLKLICQVDNATLTDLCGYIFQDPMDPDVGELLAVGEIVLEIFDAYLAAYVEDWVGIDVLGIGEDVRDILKELQLISTYEFKVEPDADGNIAPEDTSATWHTVSFRWTYGQDCQPNDDACGKVSFNMQSIGQNAIIATFGATVTVVEGYSELVIKPHSLQLKYGALLNYILQKVVMPRIFGDGSDGEPVIDSYEKLIKSLLGGGKTCLVPAAGEPTCCAAFSSNVIDQVGSATVPADLLTNACESLILLGSKYLEDTLTDLDLSTGENLVLKTPDGIPCRLFDNTNSMHIDAWGKKEPTADRCIWDIQMSIFGADTAIDKNNFYGSLAE